jgi:hypothetical protein
VGKLYISFVNEQYEYMHETYGSVEMYTIYNLLLEFLKSTATPLLALE